MKAPSFRLLTAASLLAPLLLLSCNPPRSQRADLKFDASVSRPAYPNGGPRVMIDSAHRNFHTASGRYRPFANLISNDGYRVSSGGAPFTPEHLRTCDILVVSNAFGPEDHEAESAFSSDEVRAARDWVESGGNLLLIADHWPCGGAAAKLSGAFGVDMSQGVTEDSMNCEGDETTIVFSSKKGLLGDHPIIRGRGSEESVGRVVTFTGQSVGVPPGAVPLLRLSETASDRRPLPPKIVHRGNDVQVIPQYRDPERAAGRAQGVALEFGKGRVVVLAEAAMMTAQVAGDGHPFGMNVPGNDNRKLALNIMHWLSRLD